MFGRQLNSTPEGYLDPRNAKDLFRLNSGPKIVALCGGVGGAKLGLGLERASAPA